MKKEDLKEIFKKAASIASEVPENMQPVAFSRALDILLGKAPEFKTEVKTRKKKGRPSEKPGKTIIDEQVEKFLQELDRTKYSYIDNFDKILDRSLLVLKIAVDEFKIDGLTSPQIAKVLTDKFRLRTYYQAVDKPLRNAKSLVDRVPAGGRAFKYKIMRPGEEYLSKIIAEKKE